MARQLQKLTPPHPRRESWSAEEARRQVGESQTGKILPYVFDAFQLQLLETVTCCGPVDCVVRGSCEETNPTGADENRSVTKLYHR